MPDKIKRGGMRLAILPETGNIYVLDGNSKEGFKWLHYDSKTPLALGTRSNIRKAKEALRETYGPDTQFFVEVE